MRRKRKTSGSNRSLWFGTSIGIAVACLLSLAAAGLLSIFVLRENISDRTVNLFSVGIQALAAFAGGLLAGKITSENKAIATTAGGIGYLAVLIVATLLFFDGMFKNVLFSTIAILGATAIALLLVIKAKVRPLGKRRKAYFR